MENIPKDISVEIALNLSPIDIVRLCATNKKFSREICNSNDFWRRKLQKDYPDETRQIEGQILSNPKNVYITRFTAVSKLIEDFIPEFIEIVFGDFGKYLNEKYREDAFTAIYDVYEDVNKNYATAIKKRIEVSGPELHPDDENDEKTSFFWDNTVSIFPSQDMEGEILEILFPLIVKLIDEFLRINISNIISGKI